MYTDIVGFTAITEKDDAFALQLNQKHKDAVSILIPEHSGVLQEIIGDGSLSYFTSASDCIRCAIALQTHFGAAPRVPVRIGLHIGEIRGENSIIHGNPLNVASRIESIAVAGSILLSKNVIDALSNRSDFSFTALGRYNFKHVKEPIEIFAVSDKGICVPERELVEGKLKILERKDIVAFDAWDDRELIRRLPTASLICQQAVCSYGFISYNYNALRDFVHRGGVLQCVFVHPESDAIQVAPERQVGAAQNISYIQGQLHLAFQKLQALGRGTTFKLTHHLPEPIMTFVDPEAEDGLLFITLSGFRMDLHDRPSFVMRRSTHRRWFDFYYQSYRNLWESEASQPVDFRKSWQENLQGL
jgi:hypothetical protein